MSQPQSALIRREVRFAGRVQGVGFRYTTRQIAARHNVTGFVQNLADGRVLLVAEGRADEVDQFVADVSNELERYIASHDVAMHPATGQFESFDIRH